MKRSSASSSKARCASPPPTVRQTLLKAGEAFVVPGGFEGVWENLTPVTKLYAIMNLKEAP